MPGLDYNARSGARQIERNDHVYFDGPAGNDKSYLIAQLAERWSSGHRTLVTCWDVLIADELREMFRAQREVVVGDLDSPMLRLAGLEENPADADHEWYTAELPSLAPAVVQTDPRDRPLRRNLRAEFQDMPGSQSSWTCWSPWRRAARRTGPSPRAPDARLVWFTSLDRHPFKDATPGDMRFVGLGARPEKL